MINPFRTGGVFGLRLVSCIGFRMFRFGVFEVFEKKQLSDSGCTLVAAVLK